MSGPPVFVEAARDEDAEDLAALERLCHTHPWTPGHFRHALRDPAQHLTVARAVDAAGRRRLVAYCVVVLAADEAQVHNLAVDPTWRRRGLARLLLGRSLAAAARGGARLALLEVRAGNREAIALYRSFGFEPAGVRRDYYEEPREDALVLRREGLERRGASRPDDS